MFHVNLHKKKAGRVYWPKADSEPESIAYWPKADSDAHFFKKKLKIKIFFLKNKNFLDEKQKMDMRKYRLTTECSQA